jgi:single-stranded-DNA-specific exonuclease
MLKEETIEDRIKRVKDSFLKKSENKEITLISHFDTDGISSAAIMIKTLKKLDKKFNVTILKSLDNEFIEKIPKESLLLILDLGSGSIEKIKETGIKDVFIIDHHQISIETEIPNNIEIINPELHNKQKISASGLTYLFCKEIDFENKKFAKLGVLGMVGDTLEKEISNLNHDILNDGEIKKKKSLLIYPSTRPINRTLEYSSNPFIPGITGDTKGVLELLREAEIKPLNGKYKSLIELNENEMEKIITAIMLRNPKTKNKKIIGDIFLIKMFNKLEDARELSAIVNACSRLGNPNIAIKFCMEIPSSKKKAESIHTKYKQHIISSLKLSTEIAKSQKGNLVIINAKDKIKDSIIGTMASIISNSSIYEEGTIIVAMALTENKDKIKVSVRNVGNYGKNMREMLISILKEMDSKGEVGGHEFAAGCKIEKKEEIEFIKKLKKYSQFEVIKI